MNIQKTSAFGIKINLIYYKALLDRCFVRFFDDFNSDFRNVNGQYIYSKKISKLKLKKILTAYLKEETLKLIKPNSIISPNYYLVIGGCLPKDNILLNLKSGYFPKKLEKLINLEYPIKYILREHDIKINLVMFNDVIDDIFLSFFKNRTQIKKVFGDEYSNLFFIKHDKLSCYSMFKIIKCIYGKTNCCNIYKDKMTEDKKVIVAINDLIDKYINNKFKLNTLSEFKIIFNEIKSFLTEIIFNNVVDTDISAFTIPRLELPH